MYMWYDIIMSVLLHYMLCLTIYLSFPRTNKGMYSSDTQASCWFQNEYLNVECSFRYCLYWNHYLSIFNLLRPGTDSMCCYHFPIRYLQDILCAWITHSCIESIILFMVIYNTVVVHYDLAPATTWLWSPLRWPLLITSRWQHAIRGSPNSGSFHPFSSGYSHTGGYIWSSWAM